MEFTTKPRTMPLSSFRKSIFAAWQNAILSNEVIKTTKFNPDGGFVNVVPASSPDKELLAKIPTIVVHQSVMNIKPSRLANTWQEINVDKDGINYRVRIMAHRMMGSYQFDIITRNLTDQYVIAGAMDSILLGSNYVNESGEEQEGPVFGPRGFIVKDINTRTSLSESYADLADTDVRVWWKPQKDVQTIEMKQFESDFERLTYKVNFWSDLWYTIDDIAIEEFSTEVTVVDEIS